MASLTKAEEDYLADIAQQLLDVDRQIQAVHAMEDITEMERSVQVAELQSRYAYLRQREWAFKDPVEERYWSSIAEKWEARKKVAVAARAQDLLPKILDNQKKSKLLDDRLAGLEEDESETRH